MDHDLEQRSYHVYEVFLAHILSLKHFLGSFVLAISISILDIILIGFLFYVILLFALVLPLFD